MKFQLLIAASLMLATATASADSIRCGNKLIKDGDPQGKVQDLCGEPTSKDRRSIVRSGFPRQRIVSLDSDRASISDRELAIHNRSHVEVTVDVWFYNLGKSRLMREILFQANRVVEIRTLGRGY